MDNEQYKGSDKAYCPLLEIILWNSVESHARCLNGQMAYPSPGCFHLGVPHYLITKRIKAMPLG